jgi:Na+/H+ antiporter NhaD/arsenite permease-like protein
MATAKSHSAQFIQIIPFSKDIWAAIFSTAGIVMLIAPILLHLTPREEDEIC